MTLTGSIAPQPLAPYTYDAGVKPDNHWEPGVYQAKYNPMLYPKVYYNANGQDYVAFWYADETKEPSNGDPWRVYDAKKNVCQ